MAVAFLASSWCTAWLWLLLAMTRPMPGIISFKSDLGAMELLEFAGAPYTTMLLAIFLLGLLPPLLLHALRPWCDHDGKAVEALQWPLLTAWLWLPCVLWIVVGLVLLLLFTTPAIAGTGGYALVLLSGAVLPFVCLNPATLDATSPSHWWRPAWPGWTALKFCLATWLAATVSSVGLEWWADVADNVLMVLLWVLDEIVSLIAAVAFVCFWLNRGRLQQARADLRGIANPTFIKGLLWQGLVLLYLLAVLAVPIVVVGVLLIFVIPQYEQWLQGMERPRPTWMVMLTTAARQELSLYVLTAAPLALYVGLVQARFIRQHDVGRSK